MRAASHLFPTSAKPVAATRAVGCPFEDRCPCRKGAWCRQRCQSTARDIPDYRMLTLEGCQDGHCAHPCHVLLEVEELATHFLEAAQISEPPVPMELVKSLDQHRPIEIRYLPLKAHYGAVWLADDEWVLHLNSNQPFFVNRFVAFHEGYHILCDLSSMRAGDTADSCRPFNEIIADYFAASILMPRRWIVEAWSRVPSVRRLATLFQVPAPAVASWVRRWVEEPGDRL